MKRTSEDRSARVSNAISLVRRKFVPRIRRDFPKAEPCIMVLERGQESPVSPERAGELGAERAGEIAALSGEFLREKSSRLPFDERTEPAKIRKAIGRGSRFYGCAVGGELVSIASISQLTPKVCKIGMVFTQPERRSRGFAASAVSRAVADAFKSGAEAVVLIADGNDPAALRLYEKIGFKKTNPQRDAGGGKPPKVKEDRIDPFVRSRVGWKADSEERLLVKLLESGKKGIPVSELTPAETRRLQRLRKQSMIEVTADRRARLTELGATVARGARKMYPEFWE